MTLTQSLRDILTSAGASLVGVADLRSITERERPDLPLGVSIVVALTPRIIAGIADGPTHEYEGEYNRANAVLTELAGRGASFLREAGYAAEAYAASIGNYDRITWTSSLPHKLAAVRSGLGWIGKSDLFVTKEFGSAVRLSTILTNAPLEAGDPVEVSGCGACGECVKICPAHAPSGRTWRAGLHRDEFVDIRACAAELLRLKEEHGFGHMICGRCIAACPWTKRWLAANGERGAGTAL
jgi:epoxyqueuosine reductase QueG